MQENTRENMQQSDGRIEEERSSWTGRRRASRDEELGRGRCGAGLLTQRRGAWALGSDGLVRAGGRPASMSDVAATGKERQKAPASASGVLATGRDRRAWLRWICRRRSTATPTSASGVLAMGREKRAWLQRTHGWRRGVGCGRDWQGAAECEGLSRGRLDEQPPEEKFVSEAEERSEEFRWKIWWPGCRRCGGRHAAMVGRDEEKGMGLGRSVRAR
ncbi:hypothetical protein BRADI_2g45646v3 [Brachypodium distachyon]|uniref:Uncharacterized protein n=1 Tax=Brachypodium distachyon TaxID=15368 RepID=A0A2K2DE05_BRADI|nr:hypothetical protein BRADI_2g45646v3 [Brachypodium distachyon]